MIENYLDLEGTESFLAAPIMEAGMKEDIRKKHGYNKTKDVFSFDDGLAEKQATFLLTALLENANVRLNSWRQRRFAKYFTEVGKRTLEEIPADKHLFPDQFHERMKSEHNHSTANNSVISKPPP